MRQILAVIRKHPVSVLYGTLLAVLTLKSSISGLFTGSWEAAIVDLAMAGLLLFFMFQKTTRLPFRQGTLPERLTAWGLLLFSNLLVLLPDNNFSGSMLRAFAFVLLLMGTLLHFSNWRFTLYCLPATLWCCIFIPFHEEIMLMASYPLRLSATMLAAFLLKLCGTGVVYSGTSLHLPDLDIAITDACSGINQLDAFLLIAYIAVKMMHKKEGWQILHFAFIIPSIIIGNSLRIVLTVLLFKGWGEVILSKFWHVSLGYMQIILALLIFLAVGRLFSIAPDNTKQEETI